MLKCETNTPEMGERVLRHFLASFEADVRNATENDVQAHFEHGQWWVTYLPSGAAWSVNDLNASDFCFEQVSQGDEE